MLSVLLSGAAEKKDNDETKMEEVVDDTKNDDNIINNNFKCCSLMELYNFTQQQRTTVIDIRAKQKYNKCHIQFSENVDEPMKLNAFNDDIEGKILIYGDLKSITNDILNHLHKLAKQQSHHKSFIVFNGEFEEFLKTYPFLCSYPEMKHKRNYYPNMILKNELYLGNGYMVEDREILLNLKITHIITVAKTFYILPEEIKKQVKHLIIQIQDDKSVSISGYFQNVCDFVDNALNENKKPKNRVFIHCMAGVSRSSTMAIAYLMKTKKYSLYDSYLYVKECRPIIHPNEGFLDELEKYEMWLYAKSTKKELINRLNQLQYKSY